MASGPGGPGTHVGRTLYDVLGVVPACSNDELRIAYRVLARSLHPDVSVVTDADRRMAELNDAWRILSDPDRRAEYDRTVSIQSPPVPDPTPQPPPVVHRSRRVAWVAGVQAQIRRLSQLAGRSATQTLLLKSPRGGRDAYEELVALIVGELLHDTEPRVRAARAAGAAPLDLGVAATLIGVRTVADRVRRESSLGISAELMMTAELLDRMWDVLAHELPTSLELALGGNPHVARALA